MTTALAAGFAKAAGKKDLIGIGLGALGAATGAAGLTQAQRTRTDVKTMREQSRAADALHSAMLYEGRTGQRLTPKMRAQIGSGYMTANQAYRRRFGVQKAAADVCSKCGAASSTCPKCGSAYCKCNSAEAGLTCSSCG